MKIPVFIGISGLLGAHGGGEKVRVRWLPEEVWRPHQGQVPGVHVGLATEGGDVGQVSNQVFQGPVMVHLKQQQQQQS